MMHWQFLITQLRSYKWTTRMFRILFLLLISTKLIGAEPTLMVAPESRLFFQPLTVKVEGVPHGSMVQIEASYYTSRGGLARSRGTYFANEHGVVDVSEQYSIYGTYEGIEPFGLIWSAKDQDEVDEEQKWDDNEPLEITFTAKIQDSIDPAKYITLEKKHRSTYRAPHVVKEKITEGALRGELYYSTEVKNPPTMLIMSGSDGGIYSTDAALFASYGYAVLALAAHNYEGRPDALSNIPLEYWQEGLHYMRERFNDDRVAILGASRGGELSLLIPSVYPELIDAVIAFTPSNVVWDGCCTPESFGKPAFTLDGEPVTFARYPESLREIVKDPESPFPHSIRAYFIESMKKPEKYGGAIEVENIDAPIMLIAGDADTTWPAEVAVSMVYKRLQENDFAHEVVKRIYPGSGHIAGAPVMNMSNSLESGNSDDGGIPLGGTVKANAHSAHKSHPEQLAFLEKYAAHQPIME